MVNELENEEWRKKSFSPEELKHSVFCNCLFEGCNFSNVHLIGSKFTDCRWPQCNLSLVKWDGARLQNCNFEECKIVGGNFNKCDPTFLSLHFKKCLYHLFLINGITEATFVEAVNFSINPLANKLKKARFSKETALQLLTYLEII